MKIVAVWFAGLRELLNRKLGTCPKCMAGSIVGSALTWPVVAACYFFHLDPLTLMIGFAVAVAFTVLMLTHVVVHMFRVAPFLRNISIRPTAPAEPVSDARQNSRREFAVLVARAGFGFAAAALWPWIRSAD